MDNQAHGLVCGLQVEDVIVAVNGKDVLGQDLNVFQDLVIQCKNNREAIRFSVYRDSKSARPLVRREEPPSPRRGGGGGGGAAGNFQEDDELPEEDHPSAMLNINQPMQATHTIRCPISPGGFQTLFCGGDEIENPAPNSRRFMNVFVDGFKEGVPNPHGRACGLREGDVVVSVNGQNVLGEDFDVFYDALKAIITANETAVLGVYRQGGGAEEQHGTGDHAAAPPPEDGTNSELDASASVHPSEHPTQTVVANCTVQCTVPESGGFQTLFAGGDPPADDTSGGDLNHEHIFVEGFVDNQDAGDIAFGRRIGLRDHDVIVAVNGQNVLGEDFDVFHATLSQIMRQGPGTPLEFSLYRASLKDTNAEPPPSSAGDSDAATGRVLPTVPPRHGESAVPNDSEVPTSNVAGENVPDKSEAPPPLPAASSKPVVPHDLIVECPSNGGNLGVLFSGGEIEDEETQFDPVVVEEFGVGSYGEQCGLKIGDTIVGVGDTDIRGMSLDDFQEMVLELLSQRQPVRFLVKRDGVATAPSTTKDEVRSDITPPPGALDASGEDEGADEGADDERQAESWQQPPPINVGTANDVTGNEQESVPSNNKWDDGEDSEREGEGEGWDPDPWAAPADRESESEAPPTPRQASAAEMMDMDTQHWLQSLNLGKFIPAFSDKQIFTIEDIGANLDKLGEVGLNSIQQRRLKHMLGQYKNEVYINLENVALMNSGVLKSQKKWKALVSPRNGKPSPPSAPLAKRNSEWPAPEQKTDATVPQDRTPQPKQKSASIDLLSPHRRPVSSAAIYSEPVKNDNRAIFKRNSTGSPSHANGTQYPYGLHHPNLPNHNRGTNAFGQSPSSTLVHAGPSDPQQQRAVTVSTLSPYVRAEQYQAMYNKLSEAKDKLAAAKNIHVLLRAVKFERMVADNNVDAAILQEKLLEIRLQTATQRKQTESLEKKYVSCFVERTAWYQALHSPECLRNVDLFDCVQIRTDVKGRHCQVGE